MQSPHYFSKKISHQIYFSKSKTDSRRIGSMRSGRNMERSGVPQNIPSLEWYILHISAHHFPYGMMHVKFTSQEKKKNRKLTEALFLVTCLTCTGSWWRVPAVPRDRPSCLFPGLQTAGKAQPLQAAQLLLPLPPRTRPSAARNLPPRFQNHVLRGRAGNLIRTNCQTRLKWGWISPAYCGNQGIALAQW